MGARGLRMILEDLMLELMQRPLVQVAQHAHCTTCRRSRARSATVSSASSLKRSRAFSNSNGNPHVNPHVISGWVSRAALMPPFTALLPQCSPCALGRSSPVPTRQQYDHDRFLRRTYLW